MLFRTWGRNMNREVSVPRDRVRGGLVQTASTSQPDLSRLKTLTPLTSSIMIPPHFLNNMKERDKQWNFIWLYGLFIKTKTQIDIYSPLSKLQGHPTNLQAFYPLLQDWRTPNCRSICKLSILFCRTKRVQYCRGLKKSRPLSHLQALNSLLQGWTNPNCRFTLQVLHSTS